jgi:hypothetical protein
MAKRNEKTTGSTAAEKLQKTVAKTWMESLSNVLTDVAKSAHKIVTESTGRILHALEQNAHNWYTVGSELLTIAKSTNERQFSRLINEVFSRFGLSKPTAYRWMGNVEVLATALPYAPARDALLTVFNGQGIVVRKDGAASINGAIAGAFKKHPVPVTGTYSECMDWAREVQVIAEKAENSTKASVEEFFKAINARFAKLLSKRYDLAVECVVIAYRAIEVKSEPLAAACFEAIEDSSIAPATAGKNALAALKRAQQGSNVADTANVA